ncbi:sensor histidine kinase [Hydrogenophaga sp. RWCD_12]|uniref:sensor histidine kinase n=1 Tax=Hydrogenophaga sp. RWCD_12 TaxID=3391190 RepID=UPI0039853C60
MNLPAATTRRSLWRHLLLWVLGAQLVVWVIVIAVGWNSSMRETRKFTDGHLVAVANLWMGAATWHHEGEPPWPLPVPSSETHEYAQDVAIMVWENRRLVNDSDQLVDGLDLSRLPDKGLVTLVYRDAKGEPHDWRAYVETARVDGRERRVMALLDLKKRYVLARDIAEHLAQPAILLLPLLSLVMWWTLRRGLRPLEQLSDEVATLDAFAGQRLESQHRFREFASTVTAINTMVDTLQEQAQRERQFASDVAHELRTPLAVITLQARAAQVEATPERLARLEQEALRAGRILTQLLDLARAQRASSTGDGQAGEPVQDALLGEVAVRLISAHAQLAHESQHEMSFVEDGGDVRVRVNPMLLELAVRNLVENALRHTPAGSQVEVRVWQDGQGRGIAVSDDGQREGVSVPPAQASSGLGLGLRLVERIAEEMGAQLVRDGGEAPMTTRFALHWPSPAGAEG